MSATFCASETSRGVPMRTSASGLKREPPLLYFEFLEADDIGLCPVEPGGQIVQAFVDVVDIESGDLHWPGLTHR